MSENYFISTTEPAYIVTVLLRNNPGMVRDCWFTKEEYFCIRQTKYNQDGTEPETKIMRLAPNEVVEMYNVIKAKVEPK